MRSCHSEARSERWLRSRSSKARLAGRSCDPSRLQCVDESHRGRGCDACRCAGTCGAQWRSAHTCQQTLQGAIGRVVSSMACFSTHTRLPLLAMCLRTHTPLLFSSCHVSSSLLRRRDRSAAVFVATSLGLWPPAPVAAVPCSALDERRGCGCGWLLLRDA